MNVELTKGRIDGRLTPQSHRSYRLLRAITVFSFLALIVGSVVVATNAAPIPTSLTLQSSPNPATTNDSLSFLGILIAGKSPVVSQSVQIQYSKDKKQWVTITTTATGPDGRYASKWKPLQGQFYLRGFFAGNVQYRSTVSNVVTQTVAQPATQTTQPSTSTKISGSTFLSTNGTYTTYANGTIVILRGVNLSGYEYVPPVRWAHSSSDYATIASWGFNAVRLPVSWENLEPRAGVYDDSYLRSVDQDIAWAKLYGIYIILDMHNICWSSQFTSCNGSYSAGIPKWAVSTYSDNDQGIQLMIHDFFAGLGPNGTPTSSSNPSMQQRLFAAWKHIASRYKGESAIAGYDVFNEPSQHYNSVDSTFTSVTLPSFYTNAIDAIRTVDSNHICFYERTDAAIQRPNVVYSPHYPGGYASQYVGTAALTASIQGFVARSRQWNVPLFIGEWGMEAVAPGIVQYITDSLSLYDTYSVGATWWDYERSTFSMALFDSSGSPRQILVQNIVRPFARQVTSPAILATTYSGLVQSFQIGTILPLQISISIPKGYLVKSIQANTSAPVNSRLYLQTLLLILPVTVSQVTVQYIHSTT